MTFSSLISAQILQIMILACFTWLITQTVARKHAHLCFLLWLVVLLKCVTPPIWSSSVGVFSWMLASQARVAMPEPEQELASWSAADSLLPESVLAPAMIPAASVDPIALDETLPSTTYASAGDTNLTRIQQPTSSSSSTPALVPARSLGKVLYQIWFAIAAMLILGAVLRARWCVRKLLAMEVESRELQAATMELGKTLKLRRPAKLLVTSMAVGPAVIGLFRPMIVIPKHIADRYSVAELRPILAHELVHIRRGDLWLGLLRHIVWAFWWFHPFVWKTSSALRWNAERCCDEEVVASLRISPKAYAKSLIGVLELKQELKAIPFAPGVRPFDITSKRLERIMQLGHGSRQNTPRWCWVVATMLAVVCLPGAGLMLRAESSDEIESRVTDVKSSSDASDTHTAKLESTESDPAGKSPIAHFVDGKPQSVPGEAAEKLVEGDVLEVVIPGWQGAIHGNPDFKEIGPGEGILMTIASDGTIPLPLDQPCKIAGLTLEAAELIVSKTMDEKRAAESDEKISLRLVRPRSINVLVIRQDQENWRPSAPDKRGVGNFVISVPMTSANVLTALANTGGLPDKDVGEVFIHRRQQKHPANVERDDSVVRIDSNRLQQVSKGLSKSSVALREGDVIVVTQAAESSSRARANDAAQVASGRNFTVPSADTINSVDSPERWKVSLAECVSISLQNSHITRTLGARIHIPLQENPDFANPQVRISIVQRADGNLALRDVEINVRNYLYELNQAYWELYFHFHNLEAARTGFASAHAIWKQAKTRQANELVGGEAANEAQSRAQYFAFKSRLQQAKSDLQNQESRLRYLLGLAATDGRLLQPIDQPTKARLEFDWSELKEDALKRAPELLRQKGRIRQQELQLTAAKNQLLPQIDAVELYRFLGLEDDGQAGEAYAATRMQMPIGFLAELAQVRNQQLQLRRAEKRLEDEQLEISHQLSAAIRRLRDRYVLAQTQFNALKAARDQVAAAEVGYQQTQNVPLDVVLDAQSRQAQSEIDFFRALTEYQLAIAEVNYRSGRLLNAMGCEIALPHDEHELDGLLDSQLNLRNFSERVGNQ